MLHCGLNTFRFFCSPGRPIGRLAEAAVKLFGGRCLYVVRPSSGSNENRVIRRYALFPGRAHQQTDGKRSDAGALPWPVLQRPYCAEQQLAVSFRNFELQSDSLQADDQRLAAEAFWRVL